MNPPSGHLQTRWSVALGTLKRFRIDLTLAIILGLVATVLSFGGSHAFDCRIFGYPTEDMWFQADVARVYCDMTDRDDPHYRLSVHPLFTLLTYPAVETLLHVFHIDTGRGARLLVAFQAFQWNILLFTLLRVLGLRRLDATLFTLMGMFSAAWIFWFTLVETYSFGSVSILMALLVTALSAHRRLSIGWFIVTGAATLSFTLTNWMTGILSAVTARGWKQGLLSTIASLLVVIALWNLQAQLFPNVGSFLTRHTEEQTYMRKAGDFRGWEAGSVMIFHTMVMPKVQVHADSFMKIQTSPLGSGTLVGPIAIAAWFLLLGLGCLGLRSGRLFRPFLLTLLGSIAGQLLLHTLYGDESFLYALHVVPLLLVLAAFSTLTRFRTWALALAGVLLVLLCANNLPLFWKTVQLFNSLPPGA